MNFVKQKTIRQFLPAQAGVPPYEVLAIVRSKGLEPLSRPQRHGGSYTLRAVDPRGREFQVTVDARIARIIKIAPFVRHPAPAGEANAPARVAPDGLSPNSRMVHGSEGQIADEEDGGLPGAASRSRAPTSMSPRPA